MIYHIIYKNNIIYLINARVVGQVLKVLIYNNDFNTRSSENK